MHALIVHGGAGLWITDMEEKAKHGCAAAVVAGRHVLQQGGSALDAAIAACVALEDDPVFNAGTGGVLNADGELELDASVMDGATLGFGAVAAIRRVKNPVLVARLVMEETDHCLLAGEGAMRFAREHGFADYEPRTTQRIAEYERRKAKVPVGTKKMRAFLKSLPEHASGTIGAVALDARGHLAAATSTGGYSMKLPGRVGDSPLPGCGTYANEWGAASATGTGEFVMRTLATRQVADWMQVGRNAQQAVQLTLNLLGEKFDADVGLIAIDRHGAVGAAHRTKSMPHAFFSGEGDIVARMRCA